METLQSPSPSPSRTVSEMETEMASELERMEAFTASFCNSLDAVRAKEEETALIRGKLPNVESALREAEDHFVKVIREKTRKEAKQVELKERISSARARNEELKRNIQVQGGCRDEYRAALSEQSLADRKGNQDSGRKEEIEEAIFWYNKVLGFQIESGRGVKFTFSGIDPKNPHVEYAFTIRYEDDNYTLLACDPQLNGTEELIKDLNRTNGLYEFVRMLRRRFQEASLLGCAPKNNAIQQESSAVSTSAPALSFSTDGSDTPKEEHPREGKRSTRKGRPVKGAMQSPLAVRCSPRLKAQKK